MKRPDWLAYALGSAQSWWSDWRAHRGGRNLAPVTSLDLPVTYVGSHDIRDECAIHGHEPIPPDCFRVCGECWHAYPTAQALVEEHNKILQEMSQIPEPIQVPRRELTPEELSQFQDDLDRAYLLRGEAWMQIVPEPLPQHFPPGLSMRKVKLTKLDEDGRPVGEPVDMPDMTVSIRPFVAGEELTVESPGAPPPELVRMLLTPLAPWEPIPYEPLTVEQVDLITCCPLCTHDW